MEASLSPIISGEIENIGTSRQQAIFHFRDYVTKENSVNSFDCQDQNTAANLLIDKLEKHQEFKSIKAIGHRVVHGMHYRQPKWVTPALVNELKQISAYDPDHLPAEIRWIELFGKRCPEVRQVACFDTSFHAGMPTVAKLLPIPRHYYTMGIQRYGFHGLSYAYLMQELEEVAGKETAQGKIILAHLGSGASLAAVKGGKSMDTSMSFTPASGVPMSSRTGDLDPGVALYLIQHEKLTPKQFNHLINHESGLLGVSETSPDMQELIRIEETDNRAAEAIDLFCYQIKKWIGAFAAVLGGLNTLIFAGGIGEHSPEIRSKICDGLTFLGIDLDEPKNGNNEPIISRDQGEVVVRVIETNEELMIARLVLQVL